MDSRSALDKFYFDGILYESEVYLNDLKSIEDKSKKKKRGKTKANDDSVFNPHQNSEDEDG
jgi:hypothetical protein